MKSFQRRETFDPVPGDIVRLLRRIDRSAGAEAGNQDQLPQLLAALKEQARVESVTASSAIEGVIVDDDRVPSLVNPRTVRFRNRNEQEFAGYRSALDHLVQDDAGEVSVGLILHLHRLLFQHTDGGGGRFKSDDNLVVDRAPDGSRRIRFTPVSARDTPYAVQELVARTGDALATQRDHPALVTAAFALDLLCIHPFADGNGRVARLLTSHLLNQTGYGVGRFVSVEQLVFETKDEYYDALAASTTGWFDDGSHALWPWAGYVLGRLVEAYDRFEVRIAAGTSMGTKQDRVRGYILVNGPSAFRMADIRKAVPGVSDQTIRIVLNQLRDAGHIISDGAGRSAAWHRA